MSSKLLQLAKTKIGCGYVYGSQGQVMTQALLNSLINTFGKKHYVLSDGTDAKKWLGTESYDCSGLIVWCLQQLGYLKAGTDYTAATLYSSLCDPIDKADLKPGDLVFIKSNGSIGHVGIYAGDNKTVEAIGTARGVVQGSSNRFNVYGRLKFDLQEDKEAEKVGKKDDKGNTPSKWAKEAVEKAVKKGIICGNENGDLMLQDAVTREQLMVFLNKFGLLD